MYKYSKNRKLERLLNSIEYEIKCGLSDEDIKRYYNEFKKEIDYNIAQYGNVLVYYYDVRCLYRECGYKSIEKFSDEKLWETYRRQVGYVVRKILGV